MSLSSTLSSTAIAVTLGAGALMGCAGEKEASDGGDSDSPPGTTTTGWYPVYCEDSSPLLTWLPETGECGSDEPLSCSCSALGYYFVRSLDPPVAPSDCLTLTFDQVAYLLMLDVEPGPYSYQWYRAYRCHGDVGYDVVELTDGDFGRENKAAYFDASGRMFAFKSHSHLQEEGYGCAGDRATAMWWGEPVLDGCPNREDYTFDDFPASWATTPP